MVCWCDTFFRVLLCGLVLVLVLPTESLFFVRIAANAASAAGFLLGRFFVEVLLISVRLVCKNWTRSEKLVVHELFGIELNFTVL
jgi:hypothetical protein